MHTLRSTLSIFMLALLPAIALPQSHAGMFHGLGIEGGAGHNSLSWSSPNNLRTPGGVAGDRTTLYLTPTIRITYQRALSEPVAVLPFIGYSRLGGSSGDDSYSIDVLEGGAFALYHLSDLSVGAGIKSNYHLNAHYHYASFDIDRSSWFTKWSGDAGARITYSISSVSISGEAWYGITNLADGPLGDAMLHVSHFRLLVGYSL